MATTPRFRELLIDILRNPRDRERGYALARWLDEKEHPRGAIVRQSFEEGVAIFNGYRKGGGSHGTPVVDIVIQLLPQRVAVEFACSCVERVMECLDEVVSATEQQPTNLLKAC